MKSVYKLVSFATMALFMSSSLVQSAEQKAPAVKSQEVFEASEDFKLKEKELMDLQKDINQKWAKYRMEQSERAEKAREARWKEYEAELQQYQKAREERDRAWHELSIKQQLAGLADAFKKQGNEIFDNHSKAGQNVTLHIDTVNNLIGVYTDEEDVKGRPVEQWELNKNTGLIVKTKRAKDGSEVHVNEKEIDIDALLRKDAPSTNGKSVTNGPQKEKGSWFETPTYSFDDEFDAEQQKGLAFKIMQFMIGLIIVTFGLLYLFFRMTKKNEQETRKQNANQVKALNDKDSSFVDFLSGKMDYENIVNPTKDKRYASGTNFVQNAPILSEQYSKAQMLLDAQKGKMRADHRTNDGFGGNNLEHLANEERGRFDDVNIEGTKNNFSLLANFSKN